VKARTLLLMCSLSLAGAQAAERIPLLYGPDGWPLGPPEKGHDLRRSVSRPAHDARVIPLPHPRPYVLEETGAISRPQSGSTLLGATGQGAAGKTHRQTETAGTPKWAPVEPVKDGGGAATLPVSVADAGDGRIQIEVHDASVGQVLAALQKSGLVRLSASDQLSRKVSGSYTGTLPQVLAHILDGYSFFLRVTASGTELHALDPSSDAKVVLRSESGDANAASRSGSSDNAASPGGSGSSAEAAPAPAAFALSAPNPVSQARARARAQQAAKTR
jgi:hypothetical protein